VTGGRRRATLLLALALPGAVASPGPALGAQRVVEVGRDGVRPQVLRVEPGDSVRFVNDDPTFAYRAQSTGGAWRFDSGPTALLEGEFVVPDALTRPGTYAYRVAQDAPFQGSVVVAGETPDAAPAASPAPSDSGRPGSGAPATAAPPPAAPVPSAVPGPLAGARSTRALGLAVAVAVVLLVGVGSLLVRLLLALSAKEQDGPRW
jgi:plastocyanin